MFLLDGSCGSNSETFWLVSTYLKNISQIGNLPQLGVQIKKYLKPPPRTFSLFRKPSILKKKKDAARALVLHLPGCAISKGNDCLPTPTFLLFFAVSFINHRNKLIKLHALLQKHRVSERTSKRGGKKDSKFDPRTCG